MDHRFAVKPLDSSHSLHISPSRPNTSDPDAIAFHANDLLPDAQKDQPSDDYYIQKAFSTLQIEDCEPCQNHQECEDVRWYLAWKNWPARVRKRVYSYLLTTTAARLRHRHVVRYAEHGIPCKLLVLSREIYLEILQFVTENNVFNLVVGRQVCAGTVLTSEEIGDPFWLRAPPLQWITTINLILELDLDRLLQPEQQSDEPLDFEDDTVYNAVTQMASIIRNARLPNLKRLILEIFEVVPEEKLIWAGCSINEVRLRETYLEVLRPLLKIGKMIEEGVWVKTVEAIYYGGQEDIDDWDPAPDYVLNIEQVLLEQGIKVLPLPLESE